MKTFHLINVFTELLAQAHSVGSIAVEYWYGTLSYIFGFWIRVLVMLLTLFLWKNILYRSSAITHTGYVYLVFK